MKRDGTPIKVAIDPKLKNSAAGEAAEEAAFLYAELREYIHSDRKPLVQRALLQSAAERILKIGGFINSRLQ